VQQDAKKRALLPMDLYIIADKYSITRLLEPIAMDIRASLELSEHPDYEVPQAVIERYYESCLQPNSSIGSTIASVIVKNCDRFTDHPRFEDYLQNYSVFSADVALEMHRQSHFQFRMISCKHCGRQTPFKKDSWCNSQPCYHCGGFR
jgi:hypothetical protein